VEKINKVNTALAIFFVAIAGVLIVGLIVLPILQEAEALKSGGFGPAPGHGGFNPGKGGGSPPGNTPGGSSTPPGL
jgi:hypothetical protein